jgi:16S rRNA (cytidine1402-2'-O)-methyltransferase
MKFQNSSTGGEQGAETPPQPGGAVSHDREMRVAASTDRTPFGTLYVVGTPIGNMGDITLRAISVLSDVDLIAAEDTRHTLRLLRHHGIEGELIAYHEHNEQERTPGLIDRIKAGASLALVSDAGTPTVSDPGYRLVHEAIAAGIAIVPIPGASAAVSALSASGLSTDAYIFIGFLPKKKGRRHALLNSLAREERTIILYESPRRLLALIDECLEMMGDRDAALARELTKLHEEFLRGSLSAIRTALRDRASIRGECTLLIGEKRSSEEEISEPLRQELRTGLAQGLRLSELVRKVAEKHRLARKKVYEEALRIRDGIDHR